jgi:predicted HAD superfamily Cof-like phosphohydrolase
MSTNPMSPFISFRERHDVKAFHEKYRLQMSNVPALLSHELFEFRSKFLQEEVDEFIAAHQRGDLPEAADALIDLAYVLHGTALLMGLPWPQMWTLVHEKNMQKIRVIRDTDSKRGSRFDVIKPEGWEPPNHRLIIGHGPWPTFMP